MRDSMLGQVQWVVTKQCKLDDLGLNPGVPFETIARSTVSLATDGFFESVAAGKIDVAKNATVENLTVSDGVRTASLSTGRTVPADIIICGTGWHQSVPFFDAPLMSRITDEDGNFLLYRLDDSRRRRAAGVQRIQSSFFSQLNAEIGALWLADLIAGGLALPAEDVQRRAIAERLAWMQERTDGKHSKGTNIIPFSVHHIDELLADIGLPLDPVTGFKQFLMPIDPGDFTYATDRLLARHRGSSALTPKNDAPALASAP